MPKPGSKAVSTTATKQPVVGWIILLAAIAACAWMWRFNSPVIDNHPQDEKHQVVDDKKPQPQPSPVDRTELKECILLAVFNKKTVNEDLDYSITLQDDKFWRETATSIVKDVEFLGDEDETGKVVLSAAKSSAPLVALFNVKTKKIVWSMPLPKGGTSEIERKLK